MKDIILNRKQEYFQAHCHGRSNILNNQVLLLFFFHSFDENESFTVDMISDSQIEIPASMK